MNDTLVKEIKSKTEFDEAIRGDKPVLIDFYATWCGPCKQLAPLLEKFAEQYKDTKFYKIDTDQVQDVTAEVGIRAMPTILMYKDGKKKGEVVGADPNKIKTMIGEVVGADPNKIETMIKDNK